MTGPAPPGAEPIPHIAERDATGEVAALYADIRATFRVGVVNLIWRHLAALEGVLPWAWQSLKPLFVGGHISGAAEAMRRACPMPVARPIPPEALGCVGLDAEARRGVAQVLAAYGRANPTSLIAIALLRASLDAGVADAGLPRSPAREIGTPIPLPPLPDLASLAPEVAAMVLRLNRLGSDRENPSMTGLYRHLAHWPPVLVLAHAALEPLHATRALQDAAGRAVAFAQAEAPSLLGLLPALPPPAEGAAVRGALDRFISDSLGRMTVSVAVLREAFPD